MDLISSTCAAGRRNEWANRQSIHVRAELRRWDVLALDFDLSFSSSTIISRYLIPFPVLATLSCTCLSVPSSLPRHRHRTSTLWIPCLMLINFYEVLTLTKRARCSNDELVSNKLISQGDRDETIRGFNTTTKISNKNKSSAKHPRWCLPDTR